MTYLNTIHPKETDSALVSLSMRAERDGVPILSGEGLRFLRQVLTMTATRKVLEIGTAIGFSAIAMAKHHPEIEVVTLERDAEMAVEARMNIKEAGLEKRITLIEADALGIDADTLDGPFDLVFIDGAKSQSLNFFKTYSPLVRKGGAVVVDNLMFHGLVGKDAPRAKNRNTRQLVRKIDAFNRWVVTLEDFDTAIHPIGDGMSLSIRRK